MQRVSFTSMKEGTAEDFRIIRQNDELTARELPARLFEHLEKMAEDDGAYKISRLDHVLQCATRAYRDEADNEWVVAALLHDIGDLLAPFSHAEVAAEILKPFVSEEIAWVVRHHGIFQMRYNKSLPDHQQNLHLKYKDHQWYQSALNFTENWDQNSFDPEYDNLPLEFFKPLVNQVIQRQSQS